MVFEARSLTYWVLGRDLKTKPAVTMPAKLSSWAESAGVWDVLLQFTDPGSMLNTDTNKNSNGVTGKRALEQVLCLFLLVES